MGHKVKQSLVNSRVDFFYYAFRNILLVSTPLLIISGLVLSHLSLHSSAAELSQADNLAISVPSSCTLSSLINGEHSKSILNGTYESGIGQSIITTYCNDRNGYVVYAIGSSNNELGNNKLVSNINDNLNNYDIVSGTATSGTTSNWAMKLSTSDIDSSIINTNAGDDTPTIEPEYKDQYAIVPTTWTKVLSKPSGTVASTTGSSFTTTYATYISTTQPAGTYLGQVRYLLAHPATNPKVLYMQDVAEWKDELNTHDTVLAIDKRDYKAYWVTKLLDGHIWMTQNLDFDIDPTRPLTSEDTDLTDHSLTGAYADGYTYDANTGITTWTPTITAKTINFEGIAVSNWTNSSTAPCSANKTDSTETGHESLGNYYNWTAAIASNNSSTMANNITNSICPKNWKLPTTNPTNNYQELANAYDITASNAIELTKEPIYIPMAGAIQDYSFVDNSSYGNYWSEPFSNNAYRLLFRSTRFEPRRTANNEKKLGLPIRCIAK